MQCLILEMLYMAISEVKRDLVVLSEAELEFLNILKNKDIEIDDYNPLYLRTLKHRILKNRKLTHEALLIDEVLDKLQFL